MLSDEEKKAIERLNKRYEFFKENPLATNVWLTLDIHSLGIVLNLIEKQSKEIERINEILIWKQKHEEQLQKEIERLNNKFEKIYNEIDNKNSQLVKALNYKLFMEDKIKAKIDYLLKHYDSENFINFEMFIKILQSLLEKE